MVHIKTNRFKNLNAYLKIYKKERKLYAVKWCLKIVQNCEIESRNTMNVGCLVGGKEKMAGFLDYLFKRG